MKKCGVYLPSWSNPWTARALDNELAKLKTEMPNLGLVYLSFCKPDTVYTKNSFDNTGLQFSSDFAVIKAAIKILRDQDVLVMLSVGGGAYWHSQVQYNAQHVVNLANDLECDGIDIDWEGTIENSHELTAAIRNTRNIYQKYISFAGFSTGAYGQVPGSPYMGTAIHALTNAGSMVDWVNIMSYDAGDFNMYNPMSAFDCYRLYFKKPLYLGIQPGKQGWGDHIITENEITSLCRFVKDQNTTDSIFVWSYRKPADITCQRVLEIAQREFSPKLSLTCPNCLAQYRMID